MRPFHGWVYGSPFYGWVCGQPVVKCKGMPGGIMQGLRGFAGGARPALRGAKAGHLRVAYLYWRVDWCREVETHKIKEY